MFNQGVFLGVMEHPDNPGKFCKQSFPALDLFLHRFLTNLCSSTTDNQLCPCTAIGCAPVPAQHPQHGSSNATASGELLIVKTIGTESCIAMLFASSRIGATAQALDLVEASHHACESFHAEPLPPAPQDQQASLQASQSSGITMNGAITTVRSFFSDIILGHFSGAMASWSPPGCQWWQH